MKFDSLMYLFNFYSILNKKIQITVMQNIVLLGMESLSQFASL